MRKFPKWFWRSIVIYIIISWLFVAVAISLTDFLSSNAWYVGYSIFYMGILAYPVFLSLCWYAYLKQ
ncbi:hypothetical protein ACFQ3N_08240 [Virgibacillus byunsanensis]|uniref:Uncharacterized protein n=1 Tax=Virgibacillus byunsanensis TaxID=570945 RepID=A0ABW3LJ87_9BACI